MINKVINLINSNGQTVKNQFIIQSHMGRLFQSYNSAIVLIDNKGIVHLSEHWDYSTTTSKYRNQFLCETSKETKLKIETGEYKMDLKLNGSISGATS